MQIENYIQPQDEISVVYRSQTMAGFKGRVLQISEGDPGSREFVILAEGKTLLKDGAIGVREDSAIFSVRRGDAWVVVPSLMSMEEAEAKSARNATNERKRANRTVPLFADQIKVRVKPASAWVEDALRSGQEALQRDHDTALRATAIRDKVSDLVTPEEFLQLVATRERYAAGAVYGICFWQKQLDHIGDTGKPYIWTPTLSVSERLSFPWLKTDVHLTWQTAPMGPQPVRVLFIGSETIMVRLIGEPIRDYDPILIPSRNVWLTPDNFLEAA